jgi:hypothetical protein
MLFILAGVLGFITIAGLGFVLAGGGAAARPRPSSAPS